MQRSNRWMVVAIGAALAIGQPGVAAARRPVLKQSLSALVNGKKVKFKNRTITTSHIGEGVAIGGGQQPHRLGQLVKGITVGCVSGVAGPTFPSSGQFCNLGYSEIKFGKGLPYKQWVAVDGVTVTFTSFDGSRLHGTFSGTVPPAAGTDAAPVTMTNGKFSVVLTQ